jgi:hypothetical protein
MIEVQRPSAFGGRPSVGSLKCAKTNLAPFARHSSRMTLANLRL